MRKSMNYHNKQIDRHIRAGQKIAEKKLISMALTVMRNHKNCTSFMIAMGNWCFFTTDSWGQLDGEIVTRSYIKPIAAFINKWNDVFYLTGNPLHIYPDGKILRDW